MNSFCRIVAVVVCAGIASVSLGQTSKPATRPSTRPLSYLDEIEHVAAELRAIEKQIPPREATSIQLDKFNGTQYGKAHAACQSLIRQSVEITVVIDDVAKESPVTGVGKYTIWGRIPHPSPNPSMPEATISVQTDDTTVGDFVRGQRLIVTANVFNARAPEEQRLKSHLAALGLGQRSPRSLELQATLAGIVKVGEKPRATVLPKDRR